MRQDHWGKGRGGRPWRRMVEQVKVRDQYVCQKCGRFEEVGDCDHIVPAYKGGKTVLSNLQWLCRNPCHRDKSDRESKEAQGAKVTVPIGTDGWPL